MNRFMLAMSSGLLMLMTRGCIKQKLPMEQEQ